MMGPFDSSLPCSLLSWLELGLVGVGLRSVLFCVGELPLAWQIEIILTT